MINQAIQIYETHGVVCGRFIIELAQQLMLNHKQTENFMIMMGDEIFEEMIELIHDQDYDWRMSDDQRRWDDGYRKEKRITELLRQHLWDDVEPYVKDEWRKEAVKRLF